MFTHALAQQKPSQRCSRRAAVNFRQHIDQELGLCAIVRGVAVDLEEVGEAVDQVVDRGSVIRALVASAPLIEKQPVAFVFLERRRIEYAKNVFLDPNGFDFGGALSRSPPVKRVHVLQHSHDFSFRILLANGSRQVSWSHMRLAKKHVDHSVRMPLPDLCDLQRGMAIASADLAQILARHAIQAVECLGVIARTDQQFVKRSPVVSPIQIEADTLPQFGFINFAAPPFVENVLIASKDSFNAKDDWPVTRQGPLLDKRCGTALGRRQSVVVPDQDQIGRT